MVIVVSKIHRIDLRLLRVALPFERVALTSDVGESGLHCLDSLLGPKILFGGSSTHRFDLLLEIDDVRLSLLLLFLCFFLFRLSFEDQLCIFFCLILESLDLLICIIRFLTGLPEILLHCFSFLGELFVFVR